MLQIIFNQTPLPLQSPKRDPIWTLPYIDQQAFVKTQKRFWPQSQPIFLLWTASKMRIWAHKRRRFWVAYSWVLFFCSSCFISILGKPVARTKAPSAPLSIKQCITRTIPVYLRMLAPTYREFKMRTLLYLNQKNTTYAHVHVFCQPLLI